VTSSVPIARRSNTLSSSLGLGEKLFASSDERKLAKALDSGLELVEAGLLEQMSFTDDLADVTSRSTPAGSASDLCSPCSPRSSARATTRTSSLPPRRSR
jgi:hypothetical protein